MISSGGPEHLELWFRQGCLGAIFEREFYSKFFSAENLFPCYKLHGGRKARANFRTVPGTYFSLFGYGPCTNLHVRPPLGNWTKTSELMSRSYYFVPLALLRSNDQTCCRTMDGTSFSSFGIPNLEAPFLKVRIMQVEFFLDGILLFVEFPEIWNYWFQ